MMREPVVYVLPVLRMVDERARSKGGTRRHCHRYPFKSNSYYLSACTHLDSGFSKAVKSVWHPFLQLVFHGRHALNDQSSLYMFHRSSDLHAIRDMVIVASREQGELGFTTAGDDA